MAVPLELWVIVNRNTDLGSLRCFWPSQPSIGSLLTLENKAVPTCHFKAAHLVGQVPICNTHFRLMRRYVEKHDG